MAFEDRGDARSDARGDMGAEEALRLLVDVLEAASEADDLASMVTTCLSTICRHTGWQVGQAWFLDEAAGVMRCSPESFHAEVEVAGFRAASLALPFPSGQGLPGRVWATLAPAWVDDPPTDENFPRGPVARADGLRAGFAFPIHQRERFFGVLEFFTRAWRPISPSLLGAVDRLGRHLANLFVRHQAEACRARLAAIVEASPDVIATAAPDGRMTYVNAAGRRVLGLGADEDVTRLAITDLYTSEDHAVLRSDALPAAIEHGTWRGDLPLRARDGRAIPVAHVLIAHRTAGEVDFLACVGHDLSARRRLEDEVRQAQKMEVVGRLASGMAHDFNNVLTLIACASSLALEKLPADHPARSELDEVVAAASRAGSLTRRLLTFGRRSVPTARAVDLHPLLGELARLLRPLLGAEVELVLELAPGPAPVRMDPGQFEQVLVNLVMNARDAIADGGRVTIRTALGLRPAVRGSARASPAPHVTVSVEDTGHGMDEATRARLFEPFFTTKAPGKGTGLGLSTSLGIVTECGGQLTVDTATGRGSTFKVHLPLCAPATDEAPRAERAAPARTVLVAEDEVAVRRLVALLLERAGYTVVQASSGTEALEVAARHDGPLDLLLADVALPRLDGPALAARLRAARPGLRVLFMSGDPQGALRADDRVIARPFTAAGLVARVDAALRT